jgi:hypothetical protein
VIAQRVQRAVFHPSEEVGVVAGLSELHHQIEHGGAASGFGAGNDGEVTFEDLLVGVALVRREGGRKEGG